MKEEQKKERILYPCYFRADLERREGRRVPKGLAVKDPTPAEIGKALKSLGIEFRVEERPHPAHWYERGGRVVAMYSGRKTELLKRVARLLARSR